MIHGDKDATMLAVEQLARLARADGDPDALVKAASAMLRLDRRVGLEVEAICVRSD